MGEGRRSGKALPGDASGASEQLFGRICVHQKFCTAEQLSEALEIAGQFNNQRHLGEILIERGHLTEAQRAAALKIQARVEAKMRQGTPAPSPVAASTAQPAQAPQQTAPAPSGDDGAPDWLAPAHDFMGEVETADGQLSPEGEIDFTDSPSGLELDDEPMVVEPSASARASASGNGQAAAARAPAPVATPAPAPAQPVAVRSQTPRNEALEQLLLTAARYGASDVHYHVGMPIVMRLNGELLPGQGEPIQPQQSEQELLAILSDEQRQAFLQSGDLDFAYEIPNVLRARVNYCRQLRGGVDAVFRLIPLKIPTIAQLGLPNTLAKLTTYREGVVLFTGPAGCGKTTTLAAVVDIVNSERKEHILTVEDPIEFVHPSKECLVNQRQAGRHTNSFARALRAALREDPDIIVVGELRDTESVALTLSAAETGHLVFGTMHTTNAVRTIGRLIDAFPPNQQNQIRAMVSESLRAVVAQRLVPTVDGKRRIPAPEVLIITPAIGNLIRERKTFQIPAVMQTQKAAGMVTLDDSLWELVQSGQITQEAARTVAENPKRFQ